MCSKLNYPLANRAESSIHDYNIISLLASFKKLMALNPRSRNIFWALNNYFFLGNTKIIKDYLELVFKIYIIFPILSIIPAVIFFYRSMLFLDYWDLGKLNRSFIISSLMLFNYLICSLEESCSVKIGLAFIIPLSVRTQKVICFMWSYT